MLEVGCRMTVVKLNWLAVEEFRDTGDIALQL